MERGKVRQCSNVRGDSIGYPCAPCHGEQLTFNFAYRNPKRCCSTSQRAVLDTNWQRNCERRASGYRRFQLVRTNFLERDFQW